MLAALIATSLLSSVPVFITIPPQPKSSTPAPNPDEYCCMSCSAGGCSAWYSDVDTGRCMQGGKVQDMSHNHGQECSAPQPKPTPQDCSTFNATSLVPNWFEQSTCTASHGCFKVKIPSEKTYNVGNSTMGPAYGWGTDWCIDHLQGMVYVKVNDEMGDQYFEVDDLEAHTSCRFLLGAYLENQKTVYKAQVYQQDGLSCVLKADKSDVESNEHAFSLYVEPAAFVTVPAPQPKLSTDECANFPYDQCGGEGFTGATCCPARYTCKQYSPSWSQCAADPVPAPSPPPGPPPSPPSPADNPCHGYPCFTANYYDHNATSLRHTCGPVTSNPTCTQLIAEGQPCFYNWDTWTCEPTSCTMGTFDACNSLCLTEDRLYKEDCTNACQRTCGQS